ncbi:hypothetical protein Vretimale_2279 [Volvox reticuliferus]|uniref:Uncharacterized protein n=1 Tax=Volvox reticuliferus TaxID=1737510 RepID=A0A8J4C4R2_9CHLO|nr:hypothetical protein Vretifemale_4565 [Volvox reticuliferus]GIL96484.1 hypothetical protein Vretimale_2279 [Volvox reticuliferus]
MAVQASKKESSNNTTKLPSSRQAAQQGASSIRSSNAATSSARKSPGPTRSSTSASPSLSRGGTCVTSLYRYLVLPGNESVLLREALERRPWWAPVPDPSLASQQPQKACKDGAQQPQQWNLWAGLNGQRFSQWELLQPGAAGASSSSMDPASIRLVNRLQEHRVVCTKSGLAAVLASIKEGRCQPTAGAAASAPPGDPARTAASGTASCSGSPGPGLDTSWIPETYVVPAGAKALATGGTALARFKAAFARHAAEERRVWIVKPTCLNRGNGIEVFDSLERIMDHLKGRPAGSSLILQKYIERPMLLGGRKFDIRAYVLVGHDGSVWFHKEAYVRTSSTLYDSSDLANRSSHLTNDAVQKHLDTYHTFEDHCKLSLEELGSALRRALAAQPPPPPASEASTTGTSLALSSLDTRPGCETGLWGAMRRCVAALFSAAVPLLNPRRLGHCFELLGLDFMLDAEGALYLIEVNTSPALFRAGAYLSDLLPRLVEEVVQKVVDPLFPPPPPTAGGYQAQAVNAVEHAEPSEATPMSASAPSGQLLLDGFVRVELDEQLAAATAAAAGAAVGGGSSKTGKAVARVPPGPSKQRQPAALATAALGLGKSAVPPIRSRASIEATAATMNSAVRHAA